MSPLLSHRVHIGPPIACQLGVRSVRSRSPLAQGEEMFLSWAMDELGARLFDERVLCDTQFISAREEGLQSVPPPAQTAYGKRMSFAETHRSWRSSRVAGSTSPITLAM